MKMITDMKRKMMIGGLSAVMMLGGTAIAAPIQSVHAAEVTAAGAQVGEAQASVTDLVNQRIQRLVEDAAYVSWREPAELKSNLANNHNLLEATGLSKDELLGRLYYIAVQDIQAAVNKGSLTADQAEAQKAEAAQLLKEAVQTKGFEAKSPEWFVNDLAQSLVLKAASAAGLEPEDVSGRLNSGGSLFTATGIPADTLVADIQRDVSGQIDIALASGELTKEKADAAKQQTKTFLDAAIWRTGYTAPAAKDDSASGQDESVTASSIVNKRLGSVVFDTAALTELPSSDLSAAVRGGSSLADAAGMSASDLSAKLYERLEQDINGAVEAGLISADEADKAKTEGLKQLQTAVSEKGYLSDRERADYSYVIYNRMQSVKADVVSVSVNDTDDTRKAIDSGVSLQEATGLTWEQLLSSVQGFVENDIANLRSSGLITAQKADELKAEAAQKIRIALSEA